MSKYKYNVTVEVDDEDDKYNEMTISSAKCSNTAYGAKPSRTSIECSVQVDDLLIKLFVKWQRNMMKERI